MIWRRGRKQIFLAYYRLPHRWISKRLRDHQICLIIKIFRLRFKILKDLIFYNNKSTRESTVIRHSIKL